jgi:hypothetical protein
MSFAGSAERIAKLPAAVGNPYVRAAVWALAISLIFGAWTMILCWYMVWGLWLVPYRVIRRGQRKRKLEARRHAEIVSRLGR